MQLLNVEDINISGGTQIRSKIDLAHVAELKAAWKEIDDVPALIVFHDGTTYWLADGFHRFHAANGNMLRVPVEIRKGTLREALLFACGANQGHGLKRSNADKRKAVKTLLDDPEWSSKSNNWISEAAGVSDNLVAELRTQVPEMEPDPVGESRTQVPEMEPDGEESPRNQQSGQKRRGKDGREQAARKPRKKKPKIDEERAAIAEYDGGADREEAEKSAEKSAEKPQPVLDDQSSEVENMIQQTDALIGKCKKAAEQLFVAIDAKRNGCQKFATTHRKLESEMRKMIESIDLADVVSGTVQTTWNNAKRLGNI